MIKEVSGDILKTSAKAIAHGVAPGDDFKNGLALSLRESWPSMYKDFRHYCHETNPKPGGIWVWAAPTGQRIINLLTQAPQAEHGSHAGAARLEYVTHSLKELAHFVTSEGIQSLALPKVATGVGRLNWDDVLPVIKKTLEPLKIPVFIYSTFQKGVQAKE